MKRFLVELMVKEAEVEAVEVAVEAVAAEVEVFLEVEAVLFVCQEAIDLDIRR